MEPVSNALLEQLILGGSGAAVGVFAVLTYHSFRDAWLKKDGERMGHIALGVARIGGAVVIALIAEALYRAPDGVPVAARSLTYATALLSIAGGYAVALWRKTVPK